MGSRLRTLFRTALALPISSLIGAGVRSPSRFTCTAAKAANTNASARATMVRQPNKTKLIIHVPCSAADHRRLLKTLPQPVGLNRPGTSLHFLGGLESCQVVRRGGTRRSCVSGRCGWSPRSAYEDDAAVGVVATRIDRIGDLVEGQGAVHPAAQAVRGDLEEKIRQLVPAWGDDCRNIPGATRG